MEHMREGKQIICKAIRKYGIDQFTFAVLERCDSALQLNERETFWISHLGSVVPVGYNRHAAGDRTAGYGHTGNTRKRQSVARKEVWSRPEYRVKLDAVHWARSERAEEIRASLSARTKKQHADGVLGGYRGGGVKTPESRAKASISSKKKWADPEYRAKISAARKGLPSPNKGIKTGKPAWNRGLNMATRTARNKEDGTQCDPS